ncbi:hypothetical protein FE772_24060 [Lysobacter enzymogenes]|nr:hypothetical protein [Lysobacter enzymogenes]QCW28265.1 hypothetical protein FE772_24060 [Lysobacter enzymogenes]
MLAGERDGETVLIPVDLEICLFPVRRLEDTGLVVGERDEGSYAPGLERAGPAQSEGPALVWLREDDRARLRAGEGAAPAGAPIEAGGWRLCANRRPWRRRASRTLVRDCAGAVGYAAYLPGFCACIDAWMLLHLNNERVADELRHALRGAARGCCGRPRITWPRSTPARSTRARSKTPRRRDRSTLPNAASSRAATCRISFASCAPTRRCWRCRRRRSRGCNACRCAGGGRR